MKHLKLAMIIATLLVACPAFGAIAFVNSVQKSGGTTGTNTSGTIAALTNGNTELVFASFYNGQLNNPHVTSITDTPGDTYTFLGRFAVTDGRCDGTGLGSTSNCPFIEVWAASITGTSCGGTGCIITVNSTPTGTGTSPAILFQQYSGVEAVNTSNVAVNGGGGPNTGGATNAVLTITTSYANDFVVGAFADNPVNTLSVNGCTARGTAIINGGGTVNEKSCDSTSLSAGTATSVGMPFSSAGWAGAAVELCTTSPCPAVGTAHNVVIIN